MKLDPVRLERQKQVVRGFWATGGRGSFLAATGFGKSLVAIMAIMMFRKRHPDEPVVICVPSDYLRHQWRELMKEHKLTEVYVNTVHTLVKRPCRAGLLILDEMHSYSSPVFSGIFRSVNYSFVLGMTATLSDDEERDQILHDRCPIFDEISLKECLDNGWVSPFVIYNYGIDLNPDDRIYYDEITGKFNRYMATFGFSLKEMYACLGDLLYRKRYARGIKGMTPEKLVVYAVQANNAMQERKGFLYNHEDIADHAVRIINRHGKGKKIITFSQTSAFCEMLTSRLGTRSNSYHTNLTPQIIGGKKYSGKKLKTRIMESFIEGEIDVLNTAKALDQGVDIPDIDMSLVCSGSSSVRQSIQRTGRNIRMKEGKRAVEINLYLRDTQSEKWLRKRQRKHPRSTIKYIFDINEITP